MGMMGENRGIAREENREKRKTKSRERSEKVKGDGDNSGSQKEHLLLISGKALPYTEHIFTLSSVEAIGHALFI